MIKKHSRSRRFSTFRVALWDVLSHASIGDSDIYFIAVHWEEIVSTFKTNYELYIRGFSFSKFSGEVYDYVHDNIHKAHNLISDIAVKTLSIPSLFLVWLYILRLKKVDDVFVMAICATLTLCATIMIFIVDNQHYFVGQLKKSAESSFARFRSKSHKSAELQENQNTQLSSLISDQYKELTDRLCAIQFRLTVIRLLVWLFVLTAFYTTVLIYWPFKMNVFWLLGGFTCTIVIISVLDMFKKKKNHQ